MKTLVEKVWNDRPHPGPLPQEREKRAPSLDDARGSRRLFAFCFDEAKRGDRLMDARRISCVQSRFPLPGGGGRGEGGRNH